MASTGVIGAEPSVLKKDPAMLGSVFDLFVDALASYRLTKLVRDDFITQPLRDFVYENSGPPDSSRMSYLVNCPWCLSIYFGAGLQVARARRPRLAQFVSRSLAVSALTGLLAERLDSRSN